MTKLECVTDAPSKGVGIGPRRALAFAGALAAVAALIMGTVAAHAGPALLFDPSDGVVLYAEDADDAWHPASLTKMMTAYLTFEALKSGKLTPETKLKMSANGVAQGPSKIGLPVGAEMDVDKALQALVIKSANDIAVMLAEGVDESLEAFVAHMNQTAARLGMTRTHFENPNGLPADTQVTTARDLAKLTRAILRDFPQYNGLWAQEEVQVGRRHIHNHNQLMKSYAGTDGMKTGFTCDSGYNVVATATRDNHKLAAVVLGESTGAARSLRAANLLEHGFQYRAWEGLLNPITIETMEVAPESVMSPLSVRNFVPGPVCGGHLRRPPGQQQQAKRPQQRVVAAQQKGEPVAKAAKAAVVTPPPVSNNSGVAAVGENKPKN